MFRNRQEAGARLADVLAEELAGAPPDAVLVLGLPRGGVVVAAEISERLGVSLDVFLTRKLGAPGDPELAIGALTETGHRSLNAEVIDLLCVPTSYIEREVQSQRDAIARLARSYRRGRPPPQVAGRQVVVTDDGAATGATVRAALQSLRERDPARLIVGLPVAPRDTAAALQVLAERVVVLEMPDPFLAVGAYYEDFQQLTEEDVVSLLRRDVPGVA